MKFVKAIAGSVALAACAAIASSASAQTLQVLTAGSSAQFGPFAVAAYALAKAGGQTAYHYTVKTSTTGCSSPSCAYIHDSRTVSGNTIPNEPGNLWLVWSNNGIWAYLSVDSIVGVRSFSAVPRATFTWGASQSALPVSSSTNYTYWADGTNDTRPTTAVYNAISGHAFTAANTDVRPEDALFATNRALNVLGYGKVADPRSGHSGQYLIGNPIISEFTPTAVANPISFAIGGGADPFTGETGPTEITIPIGAAPIVFVASTASGSDLTNATNITTANAQEIFSGTNCSSSLVTGASSGSIYPVLREPLSGTMNTTEFTVFTPGDPSSGTSQETGVKTNPLDQACSSGGGQRLRAVGTGDEVNNVISHADALGYAFFSYESVGGGKTDRYLELNGVDGLAVKGGSAYTGSLPTCPVVSGQYTCPLVGGTSFEHLRDGSYKAWSIYRVVTDSTGQSAAQALVNKAEALVDSNIPDFVPFSPQCATTTKIGSQSNANDPGLDVYREHFVPTLGSETNIEKIPDSISITPNDGSLGSTVTCTLIRGSLKPLTLGGGAEAGGDVGGTIEGPFTSSPTYPGPTESAPH